MIRILNIITIWVFGGKAIFFIPIKFFIQQLSQHIQLSFAELQIIDEIAFYGYYNVAMPIFRKVFQSDFPNDFQHDFIFQKPLYSFLRIFDTVQNCLGINCHFANIGKGIFFQYGNFFLRQTGILYFQAENTDEVIQQRLIRVFAFLQLLQFVREVVFSQIADPGGEPSLPQVVLGVGKVEVFTEIFQ